MKKHSFFILRWLEQRNGFDWQRIDSTCLQMEAEKRFGKSQTKQLIRVGLLPAEVRDVHK